ncbi:hypothetical protein Mapa_015305 [Marchantia paleacea]|nr:hypothetical protein Mapa_015305 [Marchantia paleacea]
MAMKKFAAQAAIALRVRCGPASIHAGFPLSVARAFSTVVDSLKYATSHEWVKVDGETAVIGITDHAQSELGDIVFAEIKGTVGDSITANDAFASVESVKAVSDVMAPVSGEIVEINSALKDEPGVINESPFEKGWFAKVKLSNPSEVDQLLDSKAYEAHVEANAH